MTNRTNVIAICAALLAAVLGCDRGDTSSIEAATSALTVAALQVDCGGPAVGAFVADTGFSGGATLTRTSTIDLSGVVNPAPMSVYQTQRYNNMSYSFSGFVPGSSNDIRLHWADTKWTTSNQRLFNVTINGTRVLTNFDVIGAAGAPNKAVARTFTVPADANGAYAIQFVGTKDAAMVSGIEIGQQIVGAFMHVNAGGPRSGNFVADRNFTGGSTVTRTNAISLAGVTNPAPLAVYQSQRFGTMSYNFPGFPAGGRNLVRLHFADTKYTATGARVFNVSINGVQLLTSFDVVAAAGGGNKAVVKELQVPADATGAYAITFGTITDSPMISGIEIVPLCTSVTLTTAAAGAAPTSKVQLTGAATCAAGVTPEYHFAFRDPASADDSWHDVTPSFGGPTLTWDTNWKSTTPMGSSYQIEVLARAVNNANGGEAEAVGTLTLTSTSQVGTSATCASAAACNDGVVTTVDTCSAGHCGVEPGAHGTQTVPGYPLPPTAPTMTPVDPATPVSVNVGLTLRASSGQTLQARVDALADPQSLSYRQYLGATDLAAYLPVSTDTNAIVSWATSHQLTAKINAGTPVVTVTGTAQQIQKALYVHLVSGPRADGTTFFGPDRVPSIDVSQSLIGVSNLDNYVLPKPADIGGTGYAPPGGAPTFDSSDVRIAYLGGAGSSCSALTGAGQTIGLVAFAGFNPMNISSYAASKGFPNFLPVQVVLGGATKPCTAIGCDGQQAFSFLTNGTSEISLDIEASLSMAPAAQVVVFQSTGGDDDIFMKMVSSPQIHQMSSSWGIRNTGLTPTLLTIMAAQGQTFFDASGDYGSLDHAVTNVSMTNPAGTCVLNDDTWIPPYTVMVGGTALDMVANVSYDDEHIYGGSAGGVFTTLPIPTWQQGINPSNAEVSTLYRNVPDVALLGAYFDLLFTTCNGAEVGHPPSAPADCNSGLVFCAPGPKDPATGIAPTVVTGCVGAGIKVVEGPIWGTSIAAPMWAGFTALINQNNTSQGLPSLGFANPTFYEIGRDATQYAADFHDVATRESPPADCAGTTHKAEAGYDLVTGLGSPTCNLINRLTQRTQSLGITLTATASANVNAPVTLTGTGFGFSPNDSVGFSVSGVPGGGGINLPDTESGDDVQTDANGNFTYSLTGTFLPPSVLCTAAQERANVVLTAHDRASAALGHEITASAVFPASLFCAEITAPHTDVNASANDPILVRDTFPGHPGSAADDGDTTTYWGSVDFDFQDFITVDLTTPRLIHRVSVLWGPSRFASAYQIQTSNDNSTWTTIGTFNITQGGQVDLTGVSVTARFVRVFMTQSSVLQVGGFSVIELQVFGQAAQ